MSRYLKSWKFETDFDGDHVIVTLRPIEQGDLLQIASLRGADGKIKNADSLPVFREIVPRYIERLEGLKDAAGADLGVAEVASSAYFMGLLARIAAELSSKASPADPTKPGEPPAPTSPEQP